MCVQIPYSSPVSPGNYPFLGVALLVVGLLFTAMYFVYQMQGGGKRNLFIELLIGFASSCALGFGVLFLMLSFGLYV